MRRMLLLRHLQYEFRICWRVNGMPGVQAQNGLRSSSCASRPILGRQHGTSEDSTILTEAEQTRSENNGHKGIRCAIFLGFKSELSGNLNAVWINVDVPPPSPSGEM